jgi:hypothetical protein
MCNCNNIVAKILFGLVKFGFNFSYVCMYICLCMLCCSDF